MVNKELSDAIRRLNFEFEKRIQEIYLVNDDREKHEKNMFSTFLRNFFK